MLNAKLEVKAFLESLSKITYFFKLPPRGFLTIFSNIKKSQLYLVTFRFINDKLQEYFMFFTMSIR